MTAVVVARVSELVTGEGRAVRHGGREYTVWLVADGEVRMLDNHCLHLGGPLADGLVEDGYVVCPWHGWSYELATGQRRTALGLLTGVGCYRAWIEDDVVWAELP